MIKLCRNSKFLSGRHGLLNTNSSWLTNCNLKLLGHKGNPECSYIHKVHQMNLATRIQFTPLSPFYRRIILLYGYLGLGLQCCRLHRGWYVTIIIQYRPCTCNVTLKGVRATIVAMEKQYYISSAWVRSLRYPARNAHASYCHLRPARLYNFFFHISS